ncbi:dihydroorotate dehydrogenase-like protein [Rikenella microfusus]|uniref:NAD-dependent dihydropyrimidine dehydrogenase subunit PreA n=2 Tax=Rikenella microfusus TaxID=28139 RepID=A0A379MS26_9BACT|nr:dihydroorotate dehydrogenase-like protein [Rikenella microfusus]SUE34323.1 NAD-dependent dihydropyrimidine dehydrogenase subunit PreA [Rikenella microfusus]HJE88554.1 dihydroorotate dehydrogenase-like protein [Rikenella microfusus]
MERIKTKYLGLELKSPVILSSSGLTSTLQRIKDAEAAGAGAVVLKSIFEEQIMSEVAHVDSYSDYPEAADYVRAYVQENSLGLYLKLIEDAKQQCDIPIIASINCRRAGEWVNYARVIEAAGADALELNIFLLPTDKETSSDEIERNYLEIIAQVKEAITIPLSVKLGAGFTNPLAVVREIYYRNVKGVVLFNRFYPTDIDIERMSVKAGDIFSHSSELANVLRWTAFVNGSLPLIDVAVSTGVHTGADAVKAMLAGASAVEIASVVYEKGLDVIGEMNDFVRDWMRRHDFQTTRDFIGRMNAKNIPNPMLYERTQFMKYYSNHE